MKKVKIIDDAYLVGHILCMCPVTWQAQYELKAGKVPQGDLEKIKKAFPMEQEQPGKKGKARQTLATLASTR